MGAKQRHSRQHRDRLDRPEHRARKGTPDSRDKQVIQGKRVTQDIGVIGDIRANRDIQVIQDKRATPGIEAKPHHAPPDSIAIRTPMGEWNACRTRQELMMMREVGRVIQTPPLS